MSLRERLAGALRRREPSVSTPAALDPADRARLQAGFEHHRAGRIAQADAAYREVLLRQPANVDALQLAGVLAHQSGDGERSAALLERAAAIAPAVASIRFNLAIAYRLLGRMGDAHAALAEALRVDPDFVEAHHLIGSLLLAENRAGEARHHLEAALRCNPQHLGALSSLGDLLKSEGELREAEALYKQVVGLAPTSPEAYANLAMTLYLRGESKQAADQMSRAVALSPSLPDTLNNLGVIASGLGQFEQAEALLRRALSLRPDSADALVNLADVLARLEKTEEGIELCDRAATLEPRFAGPHAALAAMRRSRGELDLAERSARRAIELDARNAQACTTLAQVFGDRGDYREARSWFERACAIQPDQPVFQFNLGLNFLLLGDYAPGFELYERGLDAKLRGTSALRERLQAIPQWRGEPLGGKRLLVWCEQGLGDSLMAMRFLPRLKALGPARVTVTCKPELTRLLTRMTAVDEVVDDVAKLIVEGFDVQCPMMSLMHRLRIRSSDDLTASPYIDVPEEMARIWKARLEQTHGYKVGLAWSGNPKLQDDANRSLKLSDLRALHRIPGIALVSLQKGAAAVECSAGDVPILNLMHQCGDLLDTAALISQLDLVISVDTAVAHLAGAMGKTVWLLTRVNGDWRWLASGNTTAWYQSMRLYRQTRHRDWNPILRALADDLQKAATEPA